MLSQNPKAFSMLGSAFDMSRIPALVQEALDPASSPDVVTLGGMDVPIRFMPSAKERRVMALAAEFYPVLAQTDLETEIGIFVLGDEIARMIPRVVGLIVAGLPGFPASEEEAALWVDNNSRTAEQLKVITEQIKKYGLQDGLGKLLAASDLMKRLAKQGAPEA